LCCCHSFIGTHIKIRQLAIIINARKIKRAIIVVNILVYPSINRCINAGRSSQQPIVTVVGIGEQWVSIDVASALPAALDDAVSNRDGRIVVVPYFITTIPEDTVAS